MAAAAAGKVAVAETAFRYALADQLGVEASKSGKSWRIVTDGKPLTGAREGRSETTGLFPAERPSRLVTPIEAVLFDLDGVITDTAGAHAASWKRLFDDFLEERGVAHGKRYRPFDMDDYRQYVDGKPRHDGVESFLASRGISLPRGSDGDSPEFETVAGLGNRKNHYFQQWLAAHPVPTLPGVLALIEKLRQSGKRIALFSSSRNAKAVLSSAGVTDLFDAIVDGNELARLHLPGKPDPAILLEAAARLGTPPAQAAVIEDAIAGVEAGVAGAFGLVIGVDRSSGNGAALERAGADFVVRSLAELSATPEGLTVKKLSTLPLFRHREQEVRTALSGKILAVFLDYDGTLTPIVEDYTKAFIGEDMRAALAGLAEVCKVAVVSGRDLQMLRGFVRLDTVTYAGSHGFEIADPGGARNSLEKGVAFLAVLDDAEERLRTRLAGIAGHAVERKRFSIAVHFRQATAEDATRIEAIVDAVLSECPGLKKGHGKMVFELRPDIEWDKGHAVDWLLERLEAGGPELLPIYVGDDITDEDAFEALAGRGLCFIVTGPDRRTAADYALADTGEVKEFLEFLTENSRRTGTQRD